MAKCSFSAPERLRYCSSAAWAAFMVVDEVLIIYDIEGTHRSLFVCGLVSLLALRLLPDE